MQCKEKHGFPAGVQKVRKFTEIRNFFISFSFCLHQSRYFFLGSRYIKW